MKFDLKNQKIHIIKDQINHSHCSLHIQDPSGNRINLDGQGNISINAPKTITLNATDIKLNAGNSIDLKAEPQKEGSGEGTVSITALKSIEATAQTQGITLTAEQSLEASSNSAALSLTASTDLTLDASDITATGSGSINMSSGDTNIM